MLVKTYCAAVMGLEAITVTIETCMTKGIQFHLSGMADTAEAIGYRDLDRGDWAERGI
jgi:magnesium chelatase family protein